MSKKLTLVIVGAVFLAAGCLIAYKVLYNEEEGILRGCVTEEGTRYFQECPEIRWKRSRLPLLVFASVDEGMGEDEEYQELVRGAISRLNRELGHAYFAYAAPGQLPDVFLLRSRQMLDGLDGGKAFHHIDPIRGEQVGIAVSTPGRFEQRIVIHELGHIIGLADDPVSVKHSIMCDIIGQVEQQFFTDLDIRLLNDIYFEGT